MVEKFDYFRIGYATAATAIKFSFFVQVISSRYFLTVFNFPDFPRLGDGLLSQESFPGSRMSDVQPHMIISLKSPTCPALSICSIDKVASESRLGQISNFTISRGKRKRGGIRRSVRLFVDVFLPTCFDRA